MPNSNFCRDDESVSGIFSALFGDKAAEFHKIIGEDEKSRQNKQIYV